MLFTASHVISGDLVIICNKSVVESKLSKQELINIYLGKKTTWSDKKKIIFITQNNAVISEQFLNEYINMIAAQYSSYWLEKVFTGQASPPKSFASDREMIQFITKTEGAIGYVSSSEGLSNVKLVEIE